MIEIVFCRATDKEHCTCVDGRKIKAIGNFNKEYVNEHIWMKHCALESHALGKCKFQTVFSRFPTIPIFFMDERRKELADESCKQTEGETIETSNIPC